MTAVDELLAFLYAQLDEDTRKITAMEREETRVRTAPIFQGHPLGWLAGVDIFVSSKRWRAEVKAKRAILDAASDLQEREGRYAEDFMRALAQPYAGREGWREEWTPGPSRA